MRKIRAALLLAAAFGCAGCAAKKPLNERITGCVVTRTWIDPQGNERKDCECQNKKQIGIDAKTGAAVFRCE